MFDTAHKESKILKTFAVAICLTISLCISAVFLGVAIQNRSLIFEELLQRSRAHFLNIVLVRTWNSNYGGVFVEKKEGVSSNPYLENPDITAKDGKVYTKKNPALMTREISEYAEKEGLFKFHITSLKPINPGNKPDEFESKALHLFESGKSEVFERQLISDKMHLRYMAPLYVKQGCLACHAKQGYKLGDVRGGISITYDIDKTQRKINRNILVITLLAIITIFLLLGTIAFFMFRLRNKLSLARQFLEKMAATDLLTGLNNRRQLITRFEEELSRAKRQKMPLGCIILDIDHFKMINDQYGHLVGDDALKNLSAILKNLVRIYDIIGRYGGEEFLIILPEILPKDLTVFAERIRSAVEQGVQIIPGMPDKRLTISLGITSLIDRDTNVNDLIKRADSALYRAKAAGRNRVESG
jgi:diguanylate cyclase (GGDEF)-like protein